MCSQVKREGAANENQRERQEAEDDGTKLKRLGERGFVRERKKEIGQKAIATSVCVCVYTSGAVLPLVTVKTTY